MNFDDEALWLKIYKALAWKLSVKCEEASLKQVIKMLTVLESFQPSPEQTYLEIEDSELKVGEGPLTTE